MKNVAGYDLPRLMTGSFGSLGLILNATFKLYPLPAASRTVVTEPATHAAAGMLVAALNASQLTPTAIEIETAPLRLLIRFESTERSVEHQAEMTLRHVQLAGVRAHTESGDFERRTWAAHAARPWTGRGVIAKMTLLPAQLAKTLDAISSAAGECEWEATGRAGIGVLLLRIDGDAAHAVRIIEQLRRRFAPGEGSIVILRRPRELSGLVDVWGPRGDAFGMMQAVKRAFDPLGVLPPLG